MANEHPIYVVIVTHDGEQWIKACLDSVLASDYPVRVFVVDNNSSDNTRALVQEYENVTLLGMDSNLGFGAGNNVGIRHALDNGADYVFLLNQDATIAPDTLSVLVQEARGNPSYGILSPVHLDNTGSNLDSPFKRFFKEAAADYFEDALVGRVKAVYPVPFVNAAAWLVSATCLRKVGGFDPIFMMYGEDNDYCDRAAFHGFRIVIVAAAGIRHERKRKPSGKVTEAVRNHAGLLEEEKRRALLWLKRPAYRFRSSLLVLTIRVFAEVVEALLGRSWRGAALRLRAYAWAVAHARTIAKHRVRCAAGRLCWIEAETDRS